MCFRYTNKLEGDVELYSLSFSVYKLTWVINNNFINNYYIFLYIRQCTKCFKQIISYIPENSSMKQMMFYTKSNYANLCLVIREVYNFLTDVIE